ncbi:GNAT family protein [Streptomyces sp. VNUA24]|uniref:GNAT family N-acetyltransferase n=1 Tax=Streptomyces sp. VNUA24 TaxID=3031131 RepID=UPI0023B7CC1A|nr:GNAT family protein [Streptomyces sp. VNUA24]WEH19880.1 GNAT family protein [Streptomyces sp. VNUA24]
MTPANRPDTVHLRAFTEADLGFLDRLCTDPEALGAFEWPGFGDPRARRKRWETDGYISAESSAVAIAGADDTVLGIVSWKPRGFPSGVTYEIGVGVLPEHRGQGVGTAAQKLLVDHLFGRTTAHRIEALTNGGNLAEQKALERLGFRREGVMRGRSFQHGEYVDVLVYGLLRSEHCAGTPSTPGAGA